MSASTTISTETQCVELPLLFNSFPELLTNMLEGPRHTYEAFVAEDMRLSNREFVQEVVALANALQTEWHLQAGQKVALLFWNQPQFMVSLFAMRLIGVVPVPINIMMTPEDIGYVLHHADISGVLATEQLALQICARMGVDVENLPFPVLVSDQETLKGKAPSYEDTVLRYAPRDADIESLLTNYTDNRPVTPHEMGLLIYTSGTTGHPKGVMLSETNVLSNLTGFHDVVQVRTDKERFLLGLPLFHAYGMMCAIYAVAERATSVYVPRFNPKLIIQQLNAESISFLPLVPTMFTVLLQAAQRIEAQNPGQAPFPTLKTCISGGAALSEALLDKLENRLGVKVLEGYGLTETSPVVAVNCAARGAITGAVGEPLKNLAIRFVDHESGHVHPIEPTKRTAEGEVQIKGPNVMLGYYKGDAATKEVTTEDGWFRTGDLGYLDAEGLLRISGGRLKDLIIRAGENIPALPIERTLSQHDFVANVAVLPRKDERLGEAIVACVELCPDVAQDRSEAALSAYKKKMSQTVRETLSASYTPDDYYFMDELPKNPTGKIVKKSIVLP